MIEIPTDLRALYHAGYVSSYQGRKFSSRGRGGRYGPMFVVEW
jgi:hypothetical protein